MSLAKDCYDAYLQVTADETEPVAFTTVYRIEHEEIRCGPYNPTGLGDYDQDQRDRLFEAMNPVHDLYWLEQDKGVNRHPTPCEDGIPNLGSQERCGFASMADLIRWFGQEFIDAVRGAGYVVAEYRVPAHLVRHGRHQVVFDFESGERVSVDA